MSRWRRQQKKRARRNPVSVQMKWVRENIGALLLMGGSWYAFRGRA